MEMTVEGGYEDFQVQRGITYKVMVGGGESGRNASLLMLKESRHD